jgi:hypothetical protein
MDINDVTKFKILDVLKDKEDLTIWRRFLRADDNHCFDCPPVQCAQSVSIAKKYIEGSRYDVVARTLDVLFSSIGRGIEQYVIDSAHKHNVRPKDIDSVYYASLIASPELIEDKIRRSAPVVGFYDFGLDNRDNVNYLLKDNQFINHNGEWMYSVNEDMIDVIEENEKYVIIGKVSLAMSRIHIQEVGQMSEDFYNNQLSQEFRTQRESGRRE